MNELERNLLFLKELTKPGCLESYPVKFRGEGISRQTVNAHLRSLVSLDQASKENVALETGAEPSDTAVRRTKHHGCDVLIICPLAKEQIMTCLAFERDFNRPNSKVHGTKEFEFPLIREISESRGSKKELSVTISVLNSQTNLKAGVRTSTLLRKHKPKFAVLTGISGTFEETERLAHVCVGESIYNVSSKVVSKSGTLPQPEFYSPNSNYKRLINNFVDVHCESVSWSKEMMKRLLNLYDAVDYEKPPKKEFIANGISCKSGGIYTSEDLRKDGEAFLEARGLDRRIRAVEMEAAGFAEACNDDDHLVPWMIFRGHCDFTDENKNNKWQRIAALSSALCVRSFLKHEFLLPEEMI